MSKTVLFQTIQFSISIQFSFIWPIDRTLSSTSTPGQVDQGAMAMNGYSIFPKAPTLLKPRHEIVWVSYPGHSLEESYHSAEMQSVSSPIPADCTHLFAELYCFKYICLIQVFCILLYTYLKQLHCFKWFIINLCK